MQTKSDFAGSTDMWSISAGGHLMKVVNLTGFTVIVIIFLCFLKMCALFKEFPKIFICSS
jgi:hypothetical protein